MRIHRSWINPAGIASGAALLLLTACGGGSSSSQSASQSASPLVVAMLAPLSGASAQAGQNSQRGAQLAVSEINAAGGIRGHQIKLHVEDDAGDVSVGTNAYQKLLADNPVALLGPNYSAVALALLPKLDKDKLPMLTAALSPQLTTQGSKWVFRIRSSDTTAAFDLVQFATQKLNLKEFALLGESSDYGQGGINSVKQALTAKGLKPVTEQKFAPDVKDLTSQILAIKQANAPATLFWGSQPPAALFAKQAKQLGYSGVVLGSNAYTDKATLDLAGSAAEGVYSVVGFIPTPDDPATKKFDDAYQKMFNDAPDSYAAAFYDGANALFKAMKDGGVAPDQISSQLTKQTYVGVSSTYKYHDNGEMAGGQEITHIKNGKPIIVAKLAT